MDCYSQNITLSIVCMILNKKFTTDGGVWEIIHKLLLIDGYGIM